MALLKVIAKFAEVIAELVAANGDAAKENAALMKAQEAAKEELDRRAFAG